MIRKIAVHLPERAVENEELAALYPDWPAEKILQKTGIRRRRVVGNECASDLAFTAAEKLLVDEDRSAIDFLLFCTQTPDYLLPTTACLLQDRLRLRTTCGALDYNLGCSGYIYGLAMSQGLVAGSLASDVLLLTGETYSRHIHPQDKSVRTIFGDAGAATVLSRKSKNKLHSFVFGTDGSGGPELMIQAGGARLATPASETAQIDESGNVRDPKCLYMNGPEIFNFTIKAVPELVQQVAAKCGCRLEEIDLFVFHQANAYMLEHLRRKLKIPQERYLLCIENCGNTVSCTIPIALDAALSTRQIRPGMRLLLAGFGVGFSWAGCILDWNEPNPYDESRVS